MDNLETYYRWKKDELTPQEEWFRSDSDNERWELINQLLNTIIGRYEIAIIDMKEYTDIRKEIYDTDEDGIPRVDKLIKKFPELNIS